MKSVNSIGSNGSLRIHTRATQPRTSSNKTFNDQFRSGLKSGIDLTNTALRQVAKPIPGSAALSASLSDAARNLAGGSRLDASNAALSATDGDMGSLQDEMARVNQEMLIKQVEISQETTRYTAHSNIVKAVFDTARAIGTNIR